MVNGVVDLLDRRGSEFFEREHIIMVPPAPEHAGSYPSVGLTCLCMPTEPAQHRRAAAPRTFNVGQGAPFAARTQSQVRDTSAAHAVHFSAVQ